jgi:hypothetical protein
MVALGYNAGCWIGIGCPLQSQVFVTVQPPQPPHMPTCLSVADGCQAGRTGVHPLTFHFGRRTTKKMHPFVLDSSALIFSCVCVSWTSSSWDRKDLDIVDLFCCELVYWERCWRNMDGNGCNGASPHCLNVYVHLE